MDPFVARTISYWVIIIGTALVLGGTYGTLRFGHQVERLAPFRRPFAPLSRRLRSLSSRPTM